MVLFGKLLYIDLSSSKHKVIEVKEEVIKYFIGGKGLGAYLLFKFLRKGVNPLGPDNVIMFLTGPLTGTPYPTSGRFVVVTKSPLTNLFLDSYVGGFLGPEIRRAGYDGIVITGKASSPVYIWIKNDSVEIRDASKLWGLEVSKAVKAIRRELRENVHVACIGPAGENLVRYASIVVDSDEDPWRAGVAGRGGAGAVMGSKNLKAIAIKGTKAIEIANKDKLKEIARKAFELLGSAKFLKVRRAIGTSFWVEPMNRFGILPTRNFSRGFMDNAVGLYGEYMRAFVKRSVTCYNCPVACGKILGSEFGDVKVEYECIALLGSNCLIDDVIKVARSVKLVNELGLDAISTGNVIAYVMELKELGIMRDEAIPSFGNIDGQLRLIKMIAYREGIGDLLAEGVARISRKFGGKAIDIAMHVKGMEIPGYEPRASWGMALAYATSDRGACHQRAWTTRAEIEGQLERFSTEGVAKFVKEVQDERAAAFSLIVCDFIPLYRPWEALSATVGIEFSEQDYLRVGERIWNLTRLFNIREMSISRKDDTLPPRVFNEPLPLPPNGKFYVRLRREVFERMLDEYYELRGWNHEGIPTKEKVRELNLDKLVPEVMSIIA